MRCNPILDAKLVGTIAEMALSSIARPFPCKAGHVYASVDDIRPLAELTPSFYGCFDWHSAVHAHWTLARLLARFPEQVPVEKIQTSMAEALRSDHLHTEYLFRTSRPGFEMPYGVAWLLMLQSALDELAHTDWAERLRALSSLAADQFGNWLESLPCPIRSGEHNQTAFAMGLVWDASATRKDLRKRIETCAKDFYSNDQDAPLAYEPSAYDFLSSSLAEADLLARFTGPADFARWFNDFVTDDLPAPVVTADRRSGKLSHWDGLNMSRAWMLARLADHLPEGHVKMPLMRDAAEAHLKLGLRGLNSEHYAGSHWLASFALYALTQATWPAPSQC